ncbi:MAG: hypothetical protein ABI591_12850 [Kofleriaceae bacterium]
MDLRDLMSIAKGIRLRPLPEVTRTFVMFAVRHPLSTQVTVKIPRYA